MVQSLLLDILGDALPVRAYTDSTACQGVVSRLGLGKLKHVEVRFLWLQEAARTRNLELLKLNTRENVADMLTKGLQPTQFEHLRDLVGLRRVTEPVPQLHMMEQVWSAVTDRVLDTATRAALDYFTEEPHDKIVRRCVREAVKQCGDADEDCHRCRGHASGPCQLAVDCYDQALERCLHSYVQVPA
ncbi:unnamed protein product [Polarella glacialis]|nr:unnamed protein product [Polarella glacialis]